jgi:hypothetical protein
VGSSPAQPLTEETGTQEYDAHNEIPRDQPSPVVSAETMASRRRQMSPSTERGSQHRFHPYGRQRLSEGQHSGPSSILPTNGITSHSPVTPFIPHEEPTPLANFSPGYQLGVQSRHPEEFQEYLLQYDQFNFQDNATPGPGSYYDSSPFTVDPYLVHTFGSDSFQ